MIFSSGVGNYHERQQWRDCLSSVLPASLSFSFGALSIIHEEKALTAVHTAAGCPFPPIYPGWLEDFGITAPSLRSPPPPALFPSPFLPGN